MKKIVLTSLCLILAGCASKPLNKAHLNYKVFPKIANYKYEFKLAIPQTNDARKSKFIFNNDNYFHQNIAQSFSDILYQEIKAANSFDDIMLVEEKLDFSPSSSEIQEIRRSFGKDAILLTQINKFNVSTRSLSDQDRSNFVNLKLFANISYKIVLADSETIIFLTTKDTSVDKVVKSDDKLYQKINELALQAIKENIAEAKNDFILTTKNTITKKQPEEQVQATTEVKVEEEKIEEQEQNQAKAETVQEPTTKEQ